MRTIIIKPGILCSWCQATHGMGIDGIAIVRRHQYTHRHPVHFCGAEHSLLWRRSLGKRFVRWARKPGSPERKA